MFDNRLTKAQRELERLRYECYAIADACGVPRSVVDDEWQTRFVVDAVEQLERLKARLLRGDV